MANNSHKLEFLDKAVKILKEGGVIIFPTDTVWGIGASIDRLDAIRRLYQIKGREEGKPTAVLVNNQPLAGNLGIIDQEAQKLANEFWPGGLTLVVKAKAAVPKEILGQVGTIGLRQPNHPLALALIQKLGTGLVASSANFANQPAPTTKESLDSNLVQIVDFFLEGEAGGEPPSTVIDTTVKPFKVIRQGRVVIK
jgi:L-threonylcarbamoyladenylate synthase